MESQKYGISLCNDSKMVERFCKLYLIQFEFIGRILQQETKPL